MKKCSKCKIEKPFSDFWISVNKKDGHAYSCKECGRLVCRSLYYRNRDILLEKSKKNYQKNKKRFIDLQRKREKRNPEKSKARRALREAVRWGKMKRLPCEVCGDVKSHGHHDDYTKPLEVRWLCQTHHSLLHRKYIPFTSIRVADLKNTPQ